MGIRGAVVIAVGLAWNAHAADPAPEWPAKMRELRGVLTELLPDVVSERSFMDKRNFKRIDANTAKLARLAAEIHVKAAQGKEKAVSDTSDPATQILAGLFAEELSRAEKELSRGNRRFAQDLLRSTTQYCMACHTRNPKGPHFNEIALPAGFDDFEKSQFLTATRQVDPAIESYKKILRAEKLAVAEPFRWEEALYQSLAVAVRVKQDPKLTQELLDLAVGNAGVFEYLRDDIQKWKAAVVAWSKEPKEPPQGEDLYSAAKSIIGDARANQEFVADRASLIQYLRASEYLHLYLGSSKAPAQASDALYLLGRCYESIQAFRLWTAHELIFEACVRHAPATPTARRCYTSLEQSIYAGYSGSAGTFIPKEVKARLSRLKALATSGG